MFLAQSLGAQVLSSYLYDAQKAAAGGTVIAGIWKNIDDWSARALGRRLADAVAGGRWRIEECFQAAKNEAGLASYQVRDYTAWYRHITLAMLAHAYLSATRATAEKGDPQPEPSSSSR